MRERDDGRPGRPLGLQPFAGVRFTGTPQEVLDRTADPPDTWAEVSPTDPDGVMDLLRPGFEGRLDELDPWARWFEDGWVRRDLPSLYVYRRSGPWGATRGLLGVLDLSGDVSAPLVPHEEVHPDLVAAQQAVAGALHAQVDPVVAVAGRPGDGPGPGTDVSPLAGLLAELTSGKPDWTVTRDGTTHELWVVDEPVRLARARTVAVGPVVVADGHHRRAAWSRDTGGTAARGLVWVVDASDETVRLDAVHRVCPGLTAATVLDSALVVAEAVDGTVAARRALARDAGPVCALVDGSGTWLLRPAPGAAPPRCTLPDHALCWLHQVWLPAWGVDPEAVEHVHGVDAAVRRAAASGGVAFLLPAPRLDDVVTAALRGTPLPAKATSFTPKPRMGLVMRHWDLADDDVVPTTSPTREPQPPVDND